MTLLPNNIHLSATNHINDADAGLKDLLAKRSVGKFPIIYFKGIEGTDLIGLKPHMLHC